MPVSKDFIAQTGDPTATGTGGECVDAFLWSHHREGPQPARYFAPEITTKLKHKSRGTVSMAVAPTDPPGCGSQFFITLADNIDYLDGKHAVFGHVVEGLETLDKINGAYLDKEGRPLQDIRIRHVEILGTSSSAPRAAYCTSCGVVQLDPRGTANNQRTRSRTRRT